MIDAAKDFATLRAFIVGRLPDDERRAFEDRLARDPALVNELEQSLRLREALGQLRASGYFANARPQRARLWTWGPALAAAASVLFALFLWLSRITEPAQILTASLESRAVAGTSSLVAAHFTFVSMRGSSVPDLDLPAAGLIEFRAAPPSDATTQRYRVSLLRQHDGASDEQVAELAGLAVGSDGYVHSYADAAQLAAGNYVLRIQPDTAGAGAGAEFPFNLRPHATDPAR